MRKKQHRAPVPRESYGNLSRRERQFIDVIYRLGEASAADIRGELPDPPSYSAVRATLKILEEKGALTHHKEGPRYVFTPTEPPAKVRRLALHQLLATFFQSSPEEALEALLDESRDDLSDAALARMVGMVEQARHERT